jgi:hypothetical protein
MMLSFLPATQRQEDEERRKFLTKILLEKFVNHPNFDL